MLSIVHSDYALILIRTLNLFAAAARIASKERFARFARERVEIERGRSVAAHTAEFRWRLLNCVIDVHFFTLRIVAVRREKNARK